MTEHTGAITITNNDYTLTQLVTINNASIGAITLSTTNVALSGSSTNLASALDGTINSTGAVTVTNNDYTVAQLKTINAGTSGTITLNTTNVLLSGDSTDIAAAFAGTVTEHTGAITITNNDYTVAELKTINAETTGAITLNTTNVALSGDSTDIVAAFAGTVTEHTGQITVTNNDYTVCLLYTSPSPRDQRGSRMPSSA